MELLITKLKECFLLLNAIEKARSKGMVAETIKIASVSLNMALEAAANEPQQPNRCLVHITGLRLRVALQV